MPRLHASTALAICMLATALALTGCGGNPTPHGSSGGSPTPGTASSNAAPDGKPLTLSFHDIDDMSGWTSCLGSMNGRECAGGRGVAATSLVQHVSQPSLAGSSAHFWLGGNQPYSNVMWWKHLQDGDPKATKYRYEFDVYMTRPELPEALEFDVNQSKHGLRWVFGTECSFRDTGRWDVWDGGAHHWVPTKVPCNTFAANAWTHVAWNFERAGDRMHYVSVEVNGVSHNVDMYMSGETNWPWDGELNVAFQMDGDVNQDDFDVWIDNMTLTGW